MPTILQALLLNWVAFLFGGFIFGKLDEHEIRRMPAWTRMASSLTLVVAAWAWFVQTNGTTAALYTLPIAIGMTFGFIGDLFMAGWIMKIPDPLGGMASFSIGHIAYIAGMLQYGSAIGVDDLGTRVISWAGWALIGVVGWYFAVYRTIKTGKPRLLHWLALVYAVLISLMAGTATALALESEVFLPLAMGAAMFVISDLLIAARMFGGFKVYLIDDFIWLLYGPAQALIVYAAAYALTSAG